MKTKYIVAVGTAFDGFTLYGPFKSHDKALEWCENAISGEPWEIVELETP